MSGNVWEWCWDWYDDIPDNPGKDYSGASSGEYHCSRGGGWNDSADSDYWGDQSSIDYISIRNCYIPPYGDEHVGFRVVRSGGK